MGGKSKMNELKSSSKGEMNINVLTITSLFFLVISCTLFSFSGLNLHESKSEKRQILEQTKNLTEKIPLVKDEIEALKERLTLKEQKAQKEQLALQKEIEQKEQQAALNQNSASARRKYFLRHGITPEQAQLRASRRREIEANRKKEAIELVKWLSKLQLRLNDASLTRQQQQTLLTEIKITEQRLLRLRPR